MNLDSNQYSKEGYCVFENVFSSLEMKKYQSVLNGMVKRLQPSEKPQFMFEPHHLTITDIQIDPTNKLAVGS